MEARGNVAHFATIGLSTIQVHPNPAKLIQDMCEQLSLAGTHTGDTIAVTSPTRMHWLHDRAARCFALEVLVQRIIELKENTSHQAIMELISEGGAEEVPSEADGSDDSSN
jgi:hypothetical protein